MVLEQLPMIDALSRHFFVTVSDTKPTSLAVRPGWCTLLWLVDSDSSLRVASVNASATGPLLLCCGPSWTSAGATTRGKVISVDFHPGEINELFFEHDLLAPSVPRAALNDRYLLEQFLTGPETGCRGLSLGPEHFDRLDGLFTALQAELAGKADVYWPCRTRSYLLELLIFARHLTIQTPPPSLAERLRTHLHANYSQALSINELARLLGTNRTTLSAQFKLHSGMTVITYLNRLRMQVAATLLRDTTLPISEILERTGVNDLSRFGRLFKAQWNQTPGEYRRKENWIFPHLSA